MPRRSHEGEKGRGQMKKRGLFLFALFIEANPADSDRDALPREFIKHGVTLDGQPLAGISPGGSSIGWKQWRLGP